MKNRLDDAQQTEQEQGTTTPKNKRPIIVSGGITFKWRLIGGILGIIGGLCYHFLLQNGQGNLVLDVLRIGAIGFLLGVVLD